MGKWYTLKGPGDNFALSCGIEAEQSQRGPLTGEVRGEQRCKEQGHM